MGRRVLSPALYYLQTSRGPHTYHTEPNSTFGSNPYPGLWIAKFLTREVWFGPLGGFYSIPHILCTEWTLRRTMILHLYSRDNYTAQGSQPNGMLSSAETGFAGLTIFCRNTAWVTDYDYAVCRTGLKILRVRWVKLDIYWDLKHIVRAAAAVDKKRKSNSLKKPKDIIKFLNLDNELTIIWEIQNCHGLLN